MTPDTEPAVQTEPTVKTEPTMNDLRTEAMFRSKNILQYTEIVYWMLRALKEQGEIKDSTLSAINLHLHAIKSNIAEWESGIYEFINKTTKKD